MTLNRKIVNECSVNDPTLFNGGGGLVISFSQEVEYKQKGGGLVITFDQTVQSTGTGLVISFPQMVRNNAIVDRITRNGFKPRITIDSQIIEDRYICGIHTIQRQEGDVAQLTFQLQPESGIQNYNAYQGKLVYYDIVRADGVKRLFTGRINKPTFDVINKRTTITCSDIRNERIESDLGSIKSNIGYFSEQLHGRELSVKEEIEKRLSTVPYSLDYDSDGIFRITPWAAKATADYTFDNSDVYYREPSVEFSERHSIVNKVNITFEYRYPRLYHKTAHYSWTYPYDVCEFMRYGYSMTSKTLVESAAKSTGWVMEGLITYDPIFPSGLYSCNFGVDGVRDVGWSTTFFNYVTTAKTETVTNTSGSGAPTIQSPVKDADGNQVYETSLAGGTDYSNVYCIGAYFKLSKNFSQTITEKYTLSVYSAASISAYDEIVETDNAGIDTSYDTAKWDSNETGTLEVNSYYVDVEPNIYDFLNGSRVALNTARTKILATHRLSSVTWQMPGQESLQLHHTVELNTTKIACKGKIRSLRHTIDAEQGEFTTDVELALSIVPFTISEDALVPPTRPEETLTIDNTNVTLQSHYGEDPTLATSANWNGMIGNKYVTAMDPAIGQLNTYKTNYPEAFVVDAPEISEQYTAARVLEATEEYSINVPRDNLQVVYE